MSARKDIRVAPPELGTLSGPEAEAFFHGVNTVIWGFPIVLFEDLMRGRTAPDAEAMTGNPRSFVNELSRMRHLRGPEYKQIATPNNDTLFIQAFCDVRREPLLLQVPAVDDRRYYVMHLWDAWGDTFDYVGTRKTGRAAGLYALTGPNWQGELPAGVQQVRCPTDCFVVWGRVGLDGPADLAAAHAVQDGLRLGPLSRHGELGQPGFDAADVAWSNLRVQQDHPGAADAGSIDEALAFFTKLARALHFTPPKPGQDDVWVDALLQIGFSEGGTRFDATRLSDAQRSGLHKAWRQAHHLMDVKAATAGEVVNGWRWSRRTGIMGLDYLYRACFAKWFTGGNSPEEAVYMLCRVDASAQPLNGQHRYRLHFEPDALPPAKAFWSVSMYQGKDGAFTPNPIQRYSIGDRTPGVQAAADGSLTLHIQHEEPAQGPAHWLPAPAGPFYLVLRLYGPDDSLPSGRWAPPVVQRVGEVSKA